MKTIKISKANCKNQTFNKRSLIKKTLLALLFFTASVKETFAQAGVDAQIKTWGTAIDTALKAAVGVFAIVGGFIVFIQYMQGNDSAQKNFIKFVIGLAIFALSATIAGTFVTP